MVRYFKFIIKKEKYQEIPQEMSPKFDRNQKNVFKRN